jgi:hypothetical protein
MHDLGRKEYLQLAENPIDLVEALYNDPSILQRGQGIPQHYPGIFYGKFYAVAYLYLLFSNICKKFKRYIH